MTIAVRGLGGIVCQRCGYAVAPTVDDEILECPACSGRSFKRTPAFDRPTTDIAKVQSSEGRPTWLSEAREQRTSSGPHLAWEEAGDVEVVPIAEGWVKIGRSGCSDICLDDPTVSRRHALVVHTETGELKALDDRSLNGLFVNGKHVEWTALEDGDELEIGRFKLYVMA
ncbi:MAG TPA: FHA domain-containing protein [Solirubrobacterales bacterium]|nr:FHA domain-containing protein [Solirubrobacterales bacterium]